MTGSLRAASGRRLAVLGLALLFVVAGGTNRCPPGVDDLLPKPYNDRTAVSGR